MRIKEFDIDPADVDVNGLFEEAAVAVAGALTLDGSLISGGTFTSADGLGRRIDIDSAGNDAGITFTIVGTDCLNTARTDVVTGSAGDSIVQSAVYFKTVSSITLSGGAAGNIIVGTCDEFEAIMPVDAYSQNPVHVSTKVTGTINFDIQYNHRNILDGTAPNWTQQTASPDFTGITLESEGNGHFTLSDAAAGVPLLGITAVRFLANTYTNGAEVQMTVNQR